VDERPPRTERLIPVTLPDKLFTELNAGFSALEPIIGAAQANAPIRLRRGTGAQVRLFLTKTQLTDLASFVHAATINWPADPSIGVAERNSATLFLRRLDDLIAAAANSGAVTD